MPPPKAHSAIPPLETAADAGGLDASFPTPLTVLVGRERETAAVCWLLRRDEVRLVTLTGPGGVGKTRLALRVAEELTADFADGIAFIPLAAIVDPSLVLPSVARSLGLRDTGDRPVATLLRAHLRPRTLLLLLDNLEQVLPAAPDLAGLLAACPSLKILATSRALLRISGEHAFPVPPLALPDTRPMRDARQSGHLLAEVAASDAACLFISRAQAVDPDFALTPDNASHIAEICRRLDGLPLAIELAAARMNVFSPATMADRLEHRLPLLIEGPCDQPPRMRTLRDAIAWGYDLLTPTEQVALRRLAVFAGGFTLEAAEAAGGDGSPSVLETIAALVDRSLLWREQSTVAGGSPERYAMLETIREFAREQLIVRGEIETVARRHANWCVAFVERMQGAGKLSQGQGLAAVEAEHPNLRAALRWLLDRGDVATALHLTGLLAEFWLRHGHLTEGIGWLERALEADQGAPTAARVEAMVGLNMLLWPRDQYARAAQLLREAEATARAVCNERALAYVRLHQGYLAAFHDDPDLAVARGEEAVAFFSTNGDAIHLDGALWLLARAALARGEDEQATALYERLLATARSWGDEISIANGFHGLAILAERRGEMGLALANYAEMAAVCHGLGDDWAAAYGLEGSAAAALALGWREEAVQLIAATDSLRQDVGAAPVSPFVIERPAHERALEMARAALGPERFAAAMAAGANFSLDKAVAAARTLSARDTGDAVMRDGARVRLTAREREVLRLVIGGLADKEIAAAMGITRRTASNHVAAILDKLDTPSRTAAATLAIRDRLV